MPVFPGPAFKNNALILISACETNRFMTKGGGPMRALSYWSASLFFESSAPRPPRRRAQGPGALPVRFQSGDRLAT